MKLNGSGIPNVFGGLKLASSLLGWFSVSANGDCKEILGAPHKRNDVPLFYYVAFAEIHL
jgi:hypothetical protein